MILAYNIGIAIYYFLILLVSPFNKKASFWIKGRRETFKYLESKLDSSKNTAWFHVSSLGEFEQGRPIIEAFKNQYPDYKILLTFFSPSGYEIRKNYTGADYICYLPLDTRRNAKRFIKLVQPKLVFFVKYDYWYHFIRRAYRSGAELFLVSGIFRENQAFFKWYGGWYSTMLSWFKHFFVQNQESIKLLAKLGYSNSTLAGDTRFDRVGQIAEKSKDIEVAEIFSKNTPTIVCGSTWPADEELLFRYINESENIKLILAPHEIHKSHIYAIENNLSLPYVLYSKAKPEDLEKAKVLVIDNIGMLSSIYKYGQVAYIGGGFGVGIHNTLEAAVYGIPVIFGPNYQKFPEAHGLIKNGGSQCFETYEELAEVLNNYFSNSQVLEAAGKAAANYVNTMKGATKLILEYLNTN